ncbi:hypothetical protein ACFWFI_41570 [Streptomyces sp. NPDC060209]|uniref:hypothetical protein n=1 Tax=Streptomyces sp. NPDC060209 TaxID=3347073 RepID=UPI003667630B
MTDRYAWFLVLCGGIGFFASRMNAPKPVVFVWIIVMGGVVIGWYFDTPDDGPRRPVLTIAAELAAVAGTVLAVVALLK